MIGRISIVILALVVLAGSHSVNSQKTDTFNGFELVDKAGNIRKPADFRDRYPTLGTYFVLDPKGNQMHATHASPGAAEYYRKNGKFADGTVLVKEVFGSEHGQLTTLVTADERGWMALAYTIFIGGIVGFGLWFWLIARCTMARVAPFALLLPVFALISSVLFLGDRMTPTLAIGALLAISGVAITQARPIARPIST